MLEEVRSAEHGEQGMLVGSCMFGEETQQLVHGDKWEATAVENTFEVVTDGLLAMVGHRGETSG